MKDILIVLEKVKILVGTGLFKGVHADYVLLYAVGAFRGTT